MLVIDGWRKTLKAEVC